MESARRYLVLITVGVLWCCVLGLQRPPPRYSQQFMPETSFSCRNKIVGSYYADPETDCQVFHVCVSVAGTVQDYKFLCPNDTAFDQESQTCADWYDVDCEAATLYYASDNFDLYRIGSGLESVHYDHLRSDAEPQDHLQRSETSDAVRSSANAVNRVSSSSQSYNGNNNNNNNNNRDLLRGSSSGSFYNSRNGREEGYGTEKSYKEDAAQDQAKKKGGGVRKVSRKQPYNGNGNYNSPSTTTTTTTSAPAVGQNGGYNNVNYYNGNAYNHHRATTYVVTSTTSTARPQQQDAVYGRSQSAQRYSVPSSTYRPSTTYQDTYSSYQSPSTTARTTAVYNNVYNSASANYNQHQSNSGGSPAFAQITTLKPSSSYSPKTSYQVGYQTYAQFPQSTTVQPSTGYQSNDYTNYQQRSYNNIQRGTSSSSSSSNVAYQSTTPASTFYDNGYANYNNNNNGQYRQATSTKQEPPQTTAKHFASNYASNSYAPPTTYSPATKKYAGADSAVAQTALRNNDDGQYSSYHQDRSTGQSVKASSTQYYDSTKPPKKANQYANGYESASSGKSYYVESSTGGGFDHARSSVGIGFSPASINHLAESPRTTTPAPRRPASATTYNPNAFSPGGQRVGQSTTTPRGVTYVSGSARPFSSTTRLPAAVGGGNGGVGGSSTTARPTKSSKKNDYDYAYYDNAGGLEYDGVDLEHVTSNKESTKIARN